jgi:hypothetical protein
MRQRHLKLTDDPFCLDTSVMLESYSKLIQQTKTRILVYEDDEKDENQRAWAE